MKKTFYLNSIFGDFSRFKILERRIIVLAIFFAMFFAVADNAVAEVARPYIIDEKSQVLFGDSVATSTYFGLENYSQSYVDGYAHLSFTYTHGKGFNAGYPPTLYISNVDPRTTSSYTIKHSSVIQSYPDINSEGWYLVDVQFDTAGFAVSIKKDGQTEVFSQYQIISGLNENDWIFLANQYPRFDPPSSYSMSFAPFRLPPEAPAEIISVDIATSTRKASLRVQIPSKDLGAFVNLSIQDEDDEEVWMAKPQIVTTAGENDLIFDFPDLTLYDQATTKVHEYSFDFSVSKDSDVLDGVSRTVPISSSIDGHPGYYNFGDDGMERISSSYNHLIQTFGAGLSGVLTQIDLRTSNPSFIYYGSRPFAVLYECPDANYGETLLFGDGCKMIYSGNPETSSGLQISTQSFYTPPITLDPAKYYFLDTRGNNQFNALPIYYGSVDDTIPDGACYHYRISSTIEILPCAGLSDLYFYLRGVTKTVSPPKPNPVLIIPGILGSAQKNGVWVIDPIMHIYDNLIQTLKDNGYTEGVDLFTFPYEWRDSNIVNALLLRTKLAEIEEICRCSKVDIVAHSMGGLLARQYIQSGHYADDVGKVIFLGTPHKGAPESYLTWEGGVVKDSGILSQAIKTFLFTESLKNGYLKVYDYIQNRPVSSIQELLPVYDYLKDSDSDLLRIYPDNYPANSFLENLNGDIIELTSGVSSIFNIVGDTGTTTVSTIRVVPSPSLPLWENGYPEGFNSATSTDKGLGFGRGDGTVPFESASFFAPDLVLNFGHTDLPTAAEGEIFNRLTGKIATTLANGWHIPNLILIIKMLSPADIVVTAPDGKKMGKDFTTGNEFNEIPGAFYSGYGTDDEYLTIPNPLDGEYKVEAQGIGSGGEYTIATALISDNVLVESYFQATILPGAIIPINVEVNGSNPENLSVEPEDQTPPIIVTHSPEAKDYLRGDIISIDVVSTDEDSGVLDFITTLDGDTVLASTTVDSFYESLGTHIFSATSTDYVGNVATSSVNFRITANVRSLITDILRCYDLGWIKTRVDRSAFISKVEKFLDNDRWTEKQRKKNGPLLKLALRTLKNFLNAQHGKAVNDRAYNLLIEDINWILNN